MVNILRLSKLLSDEYMSTREGNHFDIDSYHYILREDTDVYTRDGKLLLKFRKKVIDKSLTDQALKSFLSASKVLHPNRGAAAGILDRNKLPGYIGELVNQSKFRTGYKSSITGIKSTQLSSNLSPSNIAGYYDRGDRNLPAPRPKCRLTAFNSKYPDLFENAIPFINRCDELFKLLVPDRYQAQHDRASLAPDWQIKDTAFSTLTLNYSWRTSLHRDKGDYKDGFGNLIVIEDETNTNEYSGCYFGMPQYGVCVDARTGDFLAADVHEWHCNTPFIPREAVVKGTNKMKNIINDWYFQRMSIVLYLRNDMVKC